MPSCSNFSIFLMVPRSILHAKVYKSSAKVYIYSFSVNHWSHHLHLSIFESCGQTKKWSFSMHGLKAKAQNWDNIKTTYKIEKKSYFLLASVNCFCRRSTNLSAYGKLRLNMHNDPPKKIKCHNVPHSNEKILIIWKKMYKFKLVDDFLV